MLTELRPDPAARLAGPTVFGPYSSTARACQARLRADARVRNDLLAAVSEETLARLRPLLERVDLKRKQVLYERNVPMPHAFFIERGAASVFSRSGDGGPIEVGTLGRGDLVGVPIVLGAERSPHRCVVQVPGEALRMSAGNLKRAVDELPHLRDLLLAYVQAVMVQGAQLVVCNMRHGLKERLARWLLVAQDRLDGHEIPLTRQSLSRAIGVRRAGITTAVGRMEREGLIRRDRGRLTIVDRAALERASCECYRAIRVEHQRVLCQATQ
jgi:CRP-like cAMP-binding protein